MVVSVDRPETPGSSFTVHVSQTVNRQAHFRGSQEEPGTLLIPGMAYSEAADTTSRMQKGNPLISQGARGFPPLFRALQEYDCAGFNTYVVCIKWGIVFLGTFTHMQQLRTDIMVFQINCRVRRPRLDPVIFTPLPLQGVLSG